MENPVEFGIDKWLSILDKYMAQYDAYNKEQFYSPKYEQTLNTIYETLRDDGVISSKGGEWSVNNAEIYSGVGNDTVYTPENAYEAEEALIKYSRIDDDWSNVPYEGKEKARSDFEKGNVTIAYRAMQLVDGELLSPMAAVIGGEKVKGLHPGDIVQSDENPDLAYAEYWGKDGKYPNKKGSVIAGKEYKKGDAKLDKDTGEIAYKFGLVKGGKDDFGEDMTDIPARYNPYIHTSLGMINDQFQSAWKRSHIVIVEVQIPNSELTSGYRAEKAKNSVGKTEWTDGIVSKALSKAGKPREVILSRYSKIVRVVPDAEVAQYYKSQLDGTDITIPYNTVPAHLRDALNEAGVNVSAPQNSTAGHKADHYYNAWVNNGKKNTPSTYDGGVKYSMMDGDPRTTTEEEVVDLLTKAKFHELKKPYFQVRVNTPLAAIIVAEHEFGKKMPDLPVFMPTKEAVDMMEETSMNDSRKNRMHGLDEDDIVSIIKGMDHPRYVVFQRNNERIGIVVPFRSSRYKQAYCVIEFSNTETTKNYLNKDQTGMQSGHYNILITAFLPDELDNYINGKSSIKHGTEEDGERWEIYTVEYNNKKGTFQGATGRLGPYDLNRNPFYVSNVPFPSHTVKASRMGDGREFSDSEYRIMNATGGRAREFAIDRLHSQYLFDTNKERYNHDIKLYSRYQRGEADRYTFFTNTIGVFKPISKRPSREPDYTSYSRGEVSSEYWYSEDGVIRGSKHWGAGIRSCDWYFDKPDNHNGVYKTNKVYGLCRWEGFIFKTQVSEDGEGIETFDGTMYSRMDDSSDFFFEQAEAAVSEERKNLAKENEQLRKTVAGLLTELAKAKDMHYSITSVCHDSVTLEGASGH